MKHALISLCAVALLAPAPAVQAEEPAGDWGGRLAGGLQVVFHIRKLTDGRYEGSTESPSQSDEIVPADRVEATPDRLVITVSRLGAVHDGVWDDLRKAWIGEVTQGRKTPLTLTRLDAAALAAMRPKRPQEAAALAAMAAFRQEQVAFDNPAAAGVRLAGTLSTPGGAGPFPAVVLIAGSGRNSRDENVVGHKVFLILAHELNRRGVAVLRYDKRGVGGSTGDFDAATTADFASDAEAAVRYLSTRADVMRAHIGLIGHSEGGVIAPMVAADDRRVAFVVLLAGPGLRGAEILLEQQALIAQASGVAPAEIARRTARDRKVFDAVLAASDPADARLRIAAALATDSPAEPPAPSAPDPAQAYTTPWMFYFLRYDPAPTLARLRVPVLAVDGSLDLQVPPKEDLGAIRRALEHDCDVTVVELAGLNHQFQTATTGSPAEYARIEQTLSPLALKTVGDWVAAHAR